MTVAGTSKALRRVSDSIEDPKLSRLVRLLEDKIEELDARLLDAERRLKVGNL